MRRFRTDKSHFTIHFGINFSIQVGYSSDVATIPPQLLVSKLGTKRRSNDAERFNIIFCLALQSLFYMLEERF